MKNLMFYGVSSLHGGVETFIFNLIEHIDRSKFKLFLLVNTPNYVKKEWLESQNVNVIIGPNRRKNFWSYKNELRKIIKDNEIDIVWSNLTSLSDINLIQAAKEEGVSRRIVYAHQSENMGGKLTGYLHDFNKKYKVKKAGTDFWGCSNYAWDYFFKGVIDFNPNYVFVNAVDPEKYSFNSVVREKKRTELKVNGKFVLGTVGRLTTEKNQKFLIDLVAQIKSTIPNIHCLIVGTGKKESELLEKVVDLDLEDTIQLLGQRSDIPELLNAFDIFVLPSLFEGLPFVLVEAQMNGLDVLVSEQVSKESRFTNQIEFLPLTLDVWQKKISSIFNIFRRQPVSQDAVRNTKFNIYNNISDFERMLK